MIEKAKGKLKFTLHNITYSLSFERFYLSSQIERIRVSGKAKEMEFQCDRPEIKLNNKRRAIKWKIISEINPEIYKHPAFIAELTLQLEYALDRIDFPRPDYTHPKNAK